METAHVDGVQDIAPAAAGSRAGAGAADGGARLGRPPLTERRKAATRLEIAREAVRLFADRGVAATTAEEIAAAAGISQRTLWRYTSSKELCVRPLLTYALDFVIALMRSWPRDRPLAEAVVGTSTPQADGARDADAEALRDLVRLTRTEPGLRAVWLQVHHDAEPAFAEVLAERGRPRAGRPGAAGAGDPAQRRAPRRGRAVGVGRGPPAASAVRHHPPCAGHRAVGPFRLTGDPRGPGRPGCSVPGRVIRDVSARAAGR